MARGQATVDAPLTDAVGKQLHPADGSTLRAGKAREHRVQMIGRSPTLSVGDRPIAGGGTVHRWIVASRV